MESLTKEISKLDENLFNTISAIFSTSAGLLAVSTALMVFVPGFGQQAVKTAGKFSADAERRIYRALLLGFGLATLMFFLSTLCGLFGLLWPSVGMLNALVVYLAVGIVSMAVTVAFFTLRVIREIK